MLALLFALTGVADAGGCKLERQFWITQGRTSMEFVPRAVLIQQEKDAARREAREPRLGGLPDLGYARFVYDRGMLEWADNTQQEVVIKSGGEVVYRHAPTPDTPQTPMNARGWTNFVVAPVNGYDRPLEILFVDKVHNKTFPFFVDDQGCVTKGEIIE